MLHNDAKIYPQCNRVNGLVIKIHKRIMKQLDCNEVVLNKRDLIFRAACIDDYNTHGVCKFGRIFFVPIADPKDLVGEYKITKDGDSFILTKII